MKNIVKYKNYGRITQKTKQKKKNKKSKEKKKCKRRKTKFLKTKNEALKVVVPTVKEHTKLAYLSQLKGERRSTNKVQHNQHY